MAGTASTTRPPGVNAEGIAERPLQRLSAFEYVNTVEDLLAVDAAAVTADLPASGIGASGYSEPGSIGNVEVDRFRSTAETLAQRALTNLEALAPCPSGVEATCAAAFIDGFSRRAYRRPVADEERAAIVALYETVRGAPLNYDYRDAIRVVVQAILQSPDFLYHREGGTGPALREGDTVRLSPHELASRVSYALGATMPDPELFAAADTGALKGPDELERQARRLLANDRARAVVDDFHSQWLNLNSLASISKDGAVFPEFDAPLAAAMRADASLFVQEAVLVDGSLNSLLTSSVAFVDGPLAAIYGVPAPSGTGPQRVVAPEAQRAGILTLPSFLSVAATTYASSPVRRGKTILQRLLCTTPEPPPPDQNTTPPAPMANAQTRERYEAHVSDAACKGCHMMMDPLGFALEHFDGIGRWRDTEAGRPVNATGAIVLDGVTQSFDGAKQLGALLAASTEVQSCVARQWMGYLGGISVGVEETALLNAVRDRFKASGHDLRELLIAIVTSRGFEQRLPAAGEVLQ